MSSQAEYPPTSRRWRLRQPEEGLSFVCSPEKNPDHCVSRSPRSLFGPGGKQGTRPSSMRSLIVTLCCDAQPSCVAASTFSQPAEMVPIVDSQHRRLLSALAMGNERARQEVAVCHFGFKQT